MREEERDSAGRFALVLEAGDPKPLRAAPENGFALAWLELDSGYLCASRAIAYFESREDGEAYLAAHRKEYPSGTPNRDSWTEHRVLGVRAGELVIPVPRRPEERSRPIRLRRR